MDNTAHIGYLIKQIADRIEMVGNNVLKQYGLTFSQSRVLAYLEQAGGKATQKEIEVHLQVAHPTVVGIISRLERDGFLRCWQDPDNRRMKNIELTDKSRQVTGLLEKSVRKNEKLLARNLGKQEQEELTRLLGLVSESLDEAIRQRQKGEGV